MLFINLSAIISLSVYFHNEMIDIVYSEILKKDITQEYMMNLIKLIRSIISKISDSLCGYITIFGNMILRALSIAKDSAGKNLIESVMELIKVIIDKYRNVAYHKTTELLAIGTTEGSIILYALRQHQKLKALELHKDNISVLAFSEDGSKLISFCNNERTLGICEINTGILAFIGMIGKCTTIGIEDKRVKLKVNGSKCGVYPKLEFNEKQIILQTSCDETYSFTY